ncbi:MAG TPA: hypothetical protein VK841_13970, partial [Polyangiaceae bacterium]|nr:hypothetical protein [Polyangiaceae bacterium]
TPTDAREAARDVYAAGSGEIYVAVAREHAIRRVPLDRIRLDAMAPVDAGRASGTSAIAAGESVLTLDPAEDVMAMSVGADLICFASGQRGPRGPMSVRAGVPPRGPFVTHRRDGPSVLAIACDRSAVVVVTADEGSTGLTSKSNVERLSFIADDRHGNWIVRSDGAITSLALDETHVYWADALDEKIVAVAKDGGLPTVLAEGRGLPKSIVAFGDTLFWVEQRGEAVWMMPKVGGSPRLVVQDFAGFAHLAAGPDGVFWVNEAAVSGGFRVLRAPLGGGDATPVAPASPAVDGIDALMVVGTDVFLARDGHVARVSTAVAGTVPSR